MMEMSGYVEREEKKKVNKEKEESITYFIFRKFLMFSSVLLMGFIFGVIGFVVYIFFGWFMAQGLYGGSATYFGNVNFFLGLLIQGACATVMFWFITGVYYLTFIRRVKV